MRNTRTNRFVEAWGEVKTVADWAEDPTCQVGYYNLYLLLMKCDWPAERTISTPQRSRGSSAAKEIQGRKMEGPPPD